MPTIKEIKAIAKDRAVNLPKKARKVDMIHILQEQEENNPCYATKQCNIDVCLWYKDCQKAIK